MPPENVERFRREHAALNRTAPPENATEQTVELARLQEQVRLLEKVMHQKPRPARARRPMAWSAALVLMVLLLCALAAWLGWLAYT